jgi:hypothetical protein
MGKETISDALGLSAEWRDNTVDAVESCIGEVEKLSDVMETIAIVVKEDEFGEPGRTGYELTAYEKKLIYAGYMIAQEMHLLQAMAAKKEIMSDIIKLMLGKNGDDIGKLFGDLGIDTDPDNDGE